LRSVSPDCHYKTPFRIKVRQNTFSWTDFQFETAARPVLAQTTSLPALSIRSSGENRTSSFAKGEATAARRHPEDDGGGPARRQA
jgi:hypothetical protein